MTQCKLGSSCSIIQSPLLPNESEYQRGSDHTVPLLAGDMWKLALYCLTSPLQGCMFTQEKSLQQTPHFQSLLHQHEVLTACSWYHSGMMLLGLSTHCVYSTLKGILQMDLQQYGLRKCFNKIIFPRQQNYSNNHEVMMTSIYLPFAFDGFASLTVCILINSDYSGRSKRFKHQTHL